MTSLSAKNICSALAGAVLIGFAALLTACKPNYPPNAKPILHTTISADGHMVATLLNAGTDQQLLRVRNLRTDAAWRTVQAPRFTQSIQFGVRGHELLISYFKPDLKINALGRLNLDLPDSAVKVIYEGVDMAFPVEVSPGRVIVRTHHPPASGREEANMFSYYWLLLEDGKEPVRVGPEQMLGTAAPSIVGTGFFFWLNYLADNTAQEKNAHIKAYPLPGGQAPQIDGGQFDESTTSLVCDHSGQRCLRQYISNKAQKLAAPYIYDLDAFLGSVRCKLPYMAGWQDYISITPDGSAAVLSLATAYDKPRHVVVMHFNLHQCESTSVEHLYFGDNAVGQMAGKIL
jgi:hypothetical protein